MYFVMLMFHVPVRLAVKQPARNAAISLGLILLFIIAAIVGIVIFIFRR